MAILLDLFCGAGGAAAGYRRAGFEVVGIDLNPQPRYPYPFVRTDAIQVRTLLRCIGKPYVIENVPGAPLLYPRILCGSQFGLTAEFGDLGTVGLRRHRLFETSFPVVDAGKHDHSLLTVTVIDGSQRIFGELVPLSVRQEAMEIDWMNRGELGESVPPAYTEHVGICLRSYLT